MRVDDLLNEKPPLTSHHVCTTIVVLLENYWTQQRRRTECRCWEWSRSQHSRFCPSRTWVGGILSVSLCTCLCVRNEASQVTRGTSSNQVAWPFPLHWDISSELSNVCDVTVRQETSVRHETWDVVDDVCVLSIPLRTHFNVGCVKYCLVRCEQRGVAQICLRHSRTRNPPDPFIPATRVGGRLLQ